MKRSTILLEWTAAVLCLLCFVTLFVKQCKQTSGMQKQKTALVNPVYKEKIKTIQIQNEGESIFLTKSKEFWKGSTVAPNYTETFFLADEETISRFTNELTKIINTYKITDTNTQKNIHFNNISNNYILTYELLDGTTYSITFGDQDFSRIYRYIKINDGNDIYKVQTENLEPHFTTDVSFWQNQNLIPLPASSPSVNDIQKITIVQDKQNKTIIPLADSNFYKNAEKLLSLRHGKLLFSESRAASTTSTGPIPLTLTAELTGGYVIRLDFFATQDNDYIVEYSFFPKEEKISFRAEVSSWTYKNIIDLLKDF